MLLVEEPRLRSMLPAITPVVRFVDDLGINRRLCSFVAAPIVDSLARITLSGFPEEILFGLN